MTSKKQLSNEINQKLHLDIDWTKLTMKDLQKVHLIALHPETHIVSIISDKVDEYVETGKSLIDNWIDEGVEKSKKRLKELFK